MDVLAGKVETLQDKFKSALQTKIDGEDTVGYLDPNSENLKKFEDQIGKINAELAKGSEASFEKVEAMRENAIKLGTEVEKEIARNKRLYSGTTEVNAVEKQRVNLKAQGGLVYEDLELVKRYNDAYNELTDTYKKYKDAGTLYDSDNQKELQGLALNTKNIGKQLEKSVAEAERLKQLVNDSGSYNGKQMSGQWNLSEDEMGNLEATMKKYLNSLNLGNIEHVKFDNVHKRLTGTLRTSNKTVADLEVKYNEATGALYAYQKAERESLTGVPAFLNGFKKKFNSIMQYLSMTMSIHQVLAQLRKGIQYIREIDLALTELKKVTDATEKEYDQFLQTAAKTGARLGTTISAVTEATATFAKLGYTMEQATEMAESAIVYKNVGDNIASTEDAADSIISTMKGFRLEATESMEIVDRFNEVKFLPPYIVMYMTKMAISEKF
jgi:methyl-accepting chemotaxis protein